MLVEDMLDMREAAGSIFDENLMEIGNLLDKLSINQLTHTIRALLATVLFTDIPPKEWDKFCEEIIDYAKTGAFYDLEVKSK